LGVETVTVQNLIVARIDAERGLLYIKGAVPGAEGSYVKVRDAIKKAIPEGAPKPAGIRKVNVATENAAPLDGAVVLDNAVAPIEGAE
jgi:large subunit ribosomal protein L3